MDIGGMTDHMIIYISGADTFRSRQYLRQTIEEFKKKRDPQGYNVAVLDSLQKDEDKILGEIRTSPFLAEKRMIIINNILSSINKDLLAELIAVVKEEKVPDTNIVVFWQGESLGKVKEIKELEASLKKQKYNQKFDLLRGIELEKWISNEIKKRGGKISQESIIYLAQNAGYDMWFLNSLIDQLVAYKSFVIPAEAGIHNHHVVNVDSCLRRNDKEDGNDRENENNREEGNNKEEDNRNNREIKLSDVQLFLDEKIDDNAFNMVEAIVSGNKKQALKLLNEQRRIGEDENKIFGLLTWQFRVLLEMRDLFERNDGISSSDMAQKLGIHPFVIRKNLYIVKRFTMSQLKNIHEKLLNIDIKTKTGLAGQSLLVDLFVVSSQE